MECQPKALLNSWVHTSSSLQKGQFQSHHTCRLKEGPWVYKVVSSSTQWPPLSVVSVTCGQPWSKNIKGKIPDITIPLLNTTVLNSVMKSCAVLPWTRIIPLSNVSMMNMLPTHWSLSRWSDRQLWSQCLCSGNPFYLIMASTSFTYLLQYVIILVLLNYCCFKSLTVPNV